MTTAGLCLPGSVSDTALMVCCGGPPSFNVSLYFSLETYSSLGYGDIVPSGTLRMMAGAEALNGLLLIGWSASYAHIAMERFWQNGEHRPQ